MSIDISVDWIAQNIAQSFLSGQTREVQERELLRVVYNTKQIAFNVFTVLTGLFAFMTLSSCLSPLCGIILTAACVAGRVVVFQNIQSSLRNYELRGITGKVLEALNKGATVLSGIEPEDNPGPILAYVTQGRRVDMSWAPSVKVFGFTVFRNTIS